MCFHVVLAPIKIENISFSESPPNPFAFILSPPCWQLLFWVLHWSSVLPVQELPRNELYVVVLAFLCKESFFHSACCLEIHPCFTCTTSYPFSLFSSMPWKSESISHSVVSDSVTPQTVAHRAPLSMEFSRQQYWSGLPIPFSRALPDSGIEPESYALPTDSLPSEALGRHSMP